MLVKVGSYVRRHHVALLALFVALGGTTAYAANEWNGSNIQDGTLTGADIQDLSLGLPDYGANSISTGKLKDGDVRTQDLRDLGVTNSKIAWDSVSSGKVINNNLTGDDINESTLAVHTVLPSGQTLRGWVHVFGKTEGGGELASDSVSFPIPLASDPIPHLVKVGTQSPGECTGTANDPQAAPGHLCVYESYVSNTVARGITGPGFDDTASRFGFTAFANHTQQTITPLFGFRATWAVTAP
jgi:hypothetical protein